MLITAWVAERATLNNLNIIHYQKKSKSFVIIKSYQWLNKILNKSILRIINKVLGTKTPNTKQAIQANNNKTAENMKTTFYYEAFILAAALGVIPACHGSACALAARHHWPTSLGRAAEVNDRAHAHVRTETRLRSQEVTRYSGYWTLGLVLFFYVLFFRSLMFCYVMGFYVWKYGFVIWFL